MLRDAVLYRMLLLGEIASALPDDLRDRYPDVACEPGPAPEPGTASLRGRGPSPGRRTRGAG